MILGRLCLQKSKILLVGGHADTPVDLLAVGNADGNRPCIVKRVSGETPVGFLLNQKRTNGSILE